MSSGLTLGCLVETQSSAQSLKAWETRQRARVSRSLIPRSMAVK